MPAPQTFESRTAAPEVDAELLEQLGVADPTFLGWLEDLDTNPLLETAARTPPLCGLTATSAIVVAWRPRLAPVQDAAPFTLFDTPLLPAA